MVKVALIHTVKSVLDTFGGKIKESMGEVKIVNIFDDFLANDPIEKGEFDVNNINRLFNIVKCAEMTGSDAIVVTCSIISHAVEKIRPFCPVPLLIINEAMLKKAVEMGRKITIMATVESTIDNTVSKLKSEAAMAGKDIQLSISLCPDATIALKAGDRQFHDEALKKKALEIKEQNVVVLAQASMAHLEEDIAKICGCTVLSSPKMCIKQLQEILGSRK